MENKWEDGKESFSCIVKEKSNGLESALAVSAYDSLFNDTWVLNYACTFQMI